MSFYRKRHLWKVSDKCGISSAYSTVPVESNAAKVKCGCTLVSHSDYRAALWSNNPLQYHILWCSYLLSNTCAMYMACIWHNVFLYDFLVRCCYLTTGSDDTVLSLILVSCVQYIWPFQPNLFLYKTWEQQQNLLLRASSAEKHICLMHLLISSLFSN